MKLIQRLQTLFISKEFRNFVIGGLSAFIIDFVLLNFLTYVLKIDTKLFDFIYIPNIISTSIAIVYSFFFQKYISFNGNSQKSAKQFPKFIAVHLTNLVLFGAIGFGILFNLGLSVQISKIITTGLQMFFSFILYKFFVFKKS